MSIASGIIGGVGSLIGGLIGSSGASAAGTTIGQMGTTVGQSMDQATNNAIAAGQGGLSQAGNYLSQGQNAIQQGMSSLQGQQNTLNNYGSQQGQLYNQMTSSLQPYQAAGTQGTSGLQSLMSNYTPFQFNAQSVANDPGLQFQQQQGLQALQSQAAAGGMLQSGSNMKAIENYSQGLASTYENQAYQQQLGQYQTNFSNQMQGMSALSNLGQTANSQNIQAGTSYGNQIGQMAGLSNQLAGYGTQLTGLSAGLSSTGSQEALQGNEYIGNATLQGMQQAGNFYMQGAQGTAAGQVGAANAWTGAFGGLTNSMMGISSLSGLGGLGGSYGVNSGANSNYSNGVNSGANSNYSNYASPETYYG